MARPPRPDFPPPTLITTTNALRELCEQLHREEFVTVDTEFMRERTYWPILCVLQLGGAQEVAVVDAQAEGIDLAPVAALFADPSVTKVFHAARQDIEIFMLRFRDIPRPLFDTQVAAMVAGFGDQVGYDSLVSAITGGSIDKTHRFSDWAVRPLSPAQIAYAAADVTYLRPVYETLRDRLRAEGRLDWVAEEMAILSNPETYRTDPDTAWERLRPRSSNRRFLSLLRALAAWREREAQRINIPRQRLVRDEVLLEIAATAPGSPEALARARGITRGFAEGRTGADLLAHIAAAKAIPESELPDVGQPRDNVRPSAALVALLKVLLAAKCEQYHVAPRLVATSDDIDRLAVADAPDIPALHGWRLEVFGNDALALKRGALALGVDSRRVKLIPTGA
ncbi:MAG TPA: ribonuclease D [Acetobacteraceae bacterium]|nr:ribonuclease D [Acetobacteraceae bacterium]